MNVSNQTFCQKYFCCCCYSQQPIMKIQIQPIKSDNHQPVQQEEQRQEIAVSSLADASQAIAKPTIIANEDEAPELIMSHRKALSTDMLTARSVINMDDNEYKKYVAARNPKRMTAPPKTGGGA